MTGSASSRWGPAAPRTLFEALSGGHRPGGSEGTGRKRSSWEIQRETP